jgi:hypothetical protein
MSNPYLYAIDFPKQYEHKDIDIIHLFYKKDWNALNNVVICRDRNGVVTARFGESKWNLKPYARSKSHYSFIFEDWDDAFELQLELKLLAYGWLFHKSNNGKAPKFTTIIQRLYKVNIVFRHLKLMNIKSLSALSDCRTLEDFKNALIEQDYSQNTLDKVFVSINKSMDLESWLQFSFGFKNKFETVKLSRELSNKKAQQTLVIPERLSDSIYGKAIELIEEALPYKLLIANTEVNLQKNYLEAKHILDTKIRNGTQLTCTNNAREIINNRKYLTAIADYLPLEIKTIIAPLSNQKIGRKIHNGRDFQQYFGQLITACYIACGGFSGMRDSELDKLTPNSYYKDNFNDHVFHMLQSNTFKLGEKRETWVAAPIAEKAIELVSTLTKAWRGQVEYPDPRYTNLLWCNQILRSRPPVLISTWNERLHRFCKQFGFLVTKEDYQECIESNPSSMNKIKESVVIGQPWPLATHQFRRSLAFYTIKHRLGTKVALKQQFKHLYLSMTEWYTNGGQLASIRELVIDKNIQQTLDIINSEMTTNKIFKQWHTNELLSGSYGKAIVKMRGDIPSIYSSWETIYEAVKKGRLTLHGTAHSYCKNGYDCDMDGIVIPQFCVDCNGQGSIIDKDQAIWWQNKHNNLVSYMEIGEDISVTDRSHYITQIRAAENVMTDFHMKFTPFEAELKVTEI